MIAPRELWQLQNISCLKHSLLHTHKKKSGEGRIVSHYRLGSTAVHLLSFHAQSSFLTMPNFALLSTPGALLRKVPPLLRITFVCPLQSGFSFCFLFFRNSACSNLDESHGRKPAMRVSEQVHPTADLIPAPHKMCNKLLKFASYRCRMQQPPHSAPPSE